MILRLRGLFGVEDEASAQTAPKPTAPTLTTEMQRSALMDEAAFARKVEAAYRGMFATWAVRACEAPRPCEKG